MDDDNRKKEAAEIKKLPISLLEYLPPRRWLAVPALIVVVVLAIILYLQLTEYDRLQTQVNKYENLWNNQQITSYQYNLKKIVSFGEDYEGIVKVQGGLATADDIVRGYVSKELDINEIYTVPDLFNVIRREYKESTDFVKVTYDRELYYPKEIRMGGDPTVEDDECSIIISDFLILEQEKPSNPDN